MTYDAQADILYVRLEGAQVVESDEAEEGVVVDYDADGKSVGIEIQDASDYVQALKSRELSQADIATT